MEIGVVNGSPAMNGLHKTNGDSTERDSLKVKTVRTRVNRYICDTRA